MLRSSLYFPIYGLVYLQIITIKNRLTPLLFYKILILYNCGAAPGEMKRTLPFKIIEKSLDLWVANKKAHGWFRVLFAVLLCVGRRQLLLVGYAFFFGAVSSCRAVGGNDLGYQVADLFLFSVVSRNHQHLKLF